MNSRSLSFLKAGTALGFVGVIAAPYIVGAAADFHPALGGIGSDLLPFPIYTPESIFNWTKSATWTPAPLLGAIALQLGSAALMVASGVKTLLAVSKKEPEQFGKGGWGKVEDARKAGLLDDDNPGPHSIVMGALGDGRYICINDDRSGLGTGPARSGKTRSALMTTGLTYKESMAIYTSGAMDVYNATSGWRSTFSDIRVLDFGDVKNCINPLDEIRVGTRHEISDTESISNSFPPEPPSKARIPWWPLGGTRITSAAILHILYTMPPHQRTLGNVYRFLHRSDADVRAAFANSSHSFVRDTFSSIPEGTGNPISTAQSYLRPWANPIVDEVTSRSDFSFSSLVNQERPVTLYFHIPEDIREATLPVLQVMISTLTKALIHSETHTRDGRVKLHKMLLALDEFHTFHVEGFDKTLAIMPKYGVRALLLTQSHKSLVELYGQSQTITTNTQVHFHLPTNDADTAEMISRAVGEYTEMRESEGQTARTFDILWMGKQKQRHEVTRRIIAAGAVRAMEKGKAFLLSTSSPAFLINSLLDFNVRRPFNTRLLPPYTGTFNDGVERPTPFEMGSF